MGCVQNQGCYLGAAGAGGCCRGERRTPGYVAVRRWKLQAASWLFGELGGELGLAGCEVAASACWAGGGRLGVCGALWGQASPSPSGTAAELAGRPLLKEVLLWVLIAWRELHGVCHRMGQEQAARALCKAVELGGGAPGCCAAQAESSSFKWE